MKRFSLPKYDNTGDIETLNAEEARVVLELANHDTRRESLLEARESVLLSLYKAEIIAHVGFALWECGDLTVAERVWRLNVADGAVWRRKKPETT